MPVIPALRRCRPENQFYIILCNRTSLGSACATGDPHLKQANKKKHKKQNPRMVQRCTESHSLRTRAGGNRSHRLSSQDNEAAHQGLGHHLVQRASRQEAPFQASPRSILRTTSPSSAPQDPARGPFPARSEMRAVEHTPYGAQVRPPPPPPPRTARLLLLPEAERTAFSTVRMEGSSNRRQVCVPSRSLLCSSQPVSESVPGAEVSGVPSHGSAQAGARCWLDTHPPHLSLLVWGEGWLSCTSAAVSVARFSGSCLLPAHPQTRPASLSSFLSLGMIFFPVSASAPGSAAC